MIDTDGSGYLDESEGKRFLGAVGCEEAELDYYWADLLRCADTDRDGLISKEEFMQYTMGDVELDEDGEPVPGCSWPEPCRSPASTRVQPEFYFLS